MANYRDFENALDITEHMYDFIPQLARRVIVEAALDSSKEFQEKQKVEKEAREKMSLDEGAVYDLRKFYGRMKV